MQLHHWHSFGPKRILLLLQFHGQGSANEFGAVEHRRRTIYHSPQKPGFTSWVGAWTMPDGDLMVSFTQATGPVTGRLMALFDRATAAH